MARKVGKIMAEFRGTANEFKETWQREVNFEEETKAFDIKALEAEPVARDDKTSTTEPAESIAAPVITEVDPARFEHLRSAESVPSENTEAAENDKKNWL